MSRAEQSRAEQSRAEQSRAEQSRAGNSRLVKLNYFRNDGSLLDDVKQSTPLVMGFIGNRYKNIPAKIQANHLYEVIHSIHKIGFKNNIKVVFFIHPVFAHDDDIKLEQTKAILQMVIDKAKQNGVLLIDHRAMKNEELFIDTTHPGRKYYKILSIEIDQIK